VTELCYHFFCDFDGTIARNDIGRLIFHQFFKVAKNHPVTQKWFRGEISSVEHLEHFYKTVTIPKEAYMKLVLEQEIDPGFKPFLAWARDRGYRVTILSDGNQTYIEPFLKRHEVACDVYCNKAKYNEETNHIEWAFPFIQKGCGLCGNCKAYHLVNLKLLSETAVYIGDGISDRYAAYAAEVVFAKKDLIPILTKEGIRFNPFQGFGDILRQLKGEENLIQKVSKALHPNCHHLEKESGLF